MGSGFLKDYGQLQPGGDDRAPLTYFKPGVDFKPYTKLMFQRVVIFLNPMTKKRLVAAVDRRQGVSPSSVGNGRTPNRL